MKRWSSASDSVWSRPTRPNRLKCLIVDAPLQELNLRFIKGMRVDRLTFVQLLRLNHSTIASVKPLRPRDDDAFESCNRILSQITQLNLLLHFTTSYRELWTVTFLPAHSDAYRLLGNHSASSLSMRSIIGINSDDVAVERDPISARI